jgi:hypothetical protein
MKTRTKLIAAAVAVALLAVVYLGLRVAREQPLARELAAVAPPAPGQGPEPAATPPTSPPSAGAHQPLEESQFIEISSSILIAVAEIQDRPDAKDLIPGLMAKVLQDAGVTEEDFEACAQRVYADPAHAKQVADAILDRVQQRATPQMRVKVGDLATEMRQAQARKKAGAPVEGKPSK